MAKVGVEGIAWLSFLTQLLAISLPVSSFCALRSLGSHTQLATTPDSIAQFKSAVIPNAVAIQKTVRSRLYSSPLPTQPQGPRWMIYLATPYK